MDANENNLTSKEGRERDARNKDLIRRYRAGDESALSKLCKLNRGFIRMKAIKHLGAFGSDLTDEDLIQEGTLGFITAVERADVERPETFLTYAGYYIEQAVIRANYDKGFTIRLPVHIMTQLSALVQADQLFCHLHGEERISALAGHLSISKDRVRLLFLSSELLHLARADKPVEAGDDSLRLKDYFRYNSDNPIDETEEGIFQEELKEALKDAIQKLTPRERAAVILRYGLVDGKIHTFGEIGDLFGLTRERIRQMIAKALRKLRYPSTTVSLRDFL